MKQVLLSSSHCRWRTWRHREVLTNIFLSITQLPFEPKRSDYRVHMIIQSTFLKIFLKIFLCRSFLKLLLNLLQYSFYFIFLYFFFSSAKDMWDLSFLTRDWTCTTLPWIVKSTTGWPGKSQTCIFVSNNLQGFCLCGSLTYSQGLE